jgi:hypothetical protein
MGEFFSREDAELAERGFPPAHKATAGGQRRNSAAEALAKAARLPAREENCKTQFQRVGCRRQTTKVSA